MPTSLSYGAMLSALTVPHRVPPPPVTTALAQRLAGVQALPPRRASASTPRLTSLQAIPQLTSVQAQTVEAMPLTLPPVACRGLIPPATGKHIKTVTLGITGIPSRDLRHFRVDIQHQSYPPGDCMSHCLYQLKQRRLLFYTHMTNDRESANLLCLFANNDGESHAILAAKKSYPPQIHSTYRLDGALSFRGDVTFFAVMQKMGDGRRQPVFTLTRTADNALVAQTAAQPSSASAIAHRVSLSQLGFQKHQFLRLKITLVRDTLHTAISVQWEEAQRRRDLFCLTLMPALNGSRYESRFGIMAMNGAEGGDAWMLIRHYSEKHRRLT